MAAFRSGGTALFHERRHDHAAPYLRARAPAPLPGRGSALRSATGPAARCARGAARYGRLCGQRAHHGCGVRHRPRCAGREWPGREHARHRHHRSRHRLSLYEVYPDRPWPGRLPDRAWPGRFRGRQGHRRDGFPARRLPDAVRAAQHRTTPVASGHVVHAARAGRARRDPRGALRRGDLPRCLRADALDPHAALEIHPPL